MAEPVIPQHAAVPACYAGELQTSRRLIAIDIIFLPCMIGNMAAISKSHAPPKKTSAFRGAIQPPPTTIPRPPVIKLLRHPVFCSHVRLLSQLDHTTCWTLYQSPLYGARCHRADPPRALLTWHSRVLLPTRKVLSNYPRLVSTMFILIPRELLPSALPPHGLRTSSPEPILRRSWISSEGSRTSLLLYRCHHMRAQSWSETMLRPFA
jgi:hypothetical protein